MKTSFFRMFGFILVLGLLFSTNPSPARADDGQPPTPTAVNVPPQPLGHHPQHGSGPDGQGRDFVTPEEAAKFKPSDQATPMSTGGPDDYGYTWDDSVPYIWHSAGSGTSTGINNSRETAGPFNLGFSFDFYGNTYTQLYVSRYGYVSFQSSYLWDDQSRMPYPEPPDNVIAPYWTPVDSVSGYVRYVKGGTAPDRWFIVEWNRLSSEGNVFTFEVVLFENGNIDLRYASMSYGYYGWWCQSAGIEDNSGLDGLSVTEYCTQVTGSHTVRIYHPADQARLHVSPLDEGMFSSPGETSEFEILIKNNGDAGTDTYELIPTTIWPVTFYAEDGLTPLTNTGGDSSIDTGPISQDESKTIVVKVATPPGASVGDANTVALTIRSNLDLMRSKTITLQTAVPTAFAQVYSDDYDGTMNLDLIHPGSRATKQASDTEWYGYNPAVTEADNGDFVYMWQNGLCIAGCQYYGYNLEYTILSKYGQTVRGVTKLTNNSSATYSVYDEMPAIAAAPDGHIGVVWYRYSYRYTTAEPNGQFIYNLYFAILDASGKVSYGPVNLTNYTTWGSWYTGKYVPEVYDPAITATDDNRFVLSWTRYSYSDCAYYDCGVENIYYAIRNTGGAAVKGITKLTNDAQRNNYWTVGYFDSNLTALNNNRFLITWTGSDYYEDIYYAVLSSGGTVAKGETELSSGCLYNNWGADAAELSDGRVVVAWSGGHWMYGYMNCFAALDLGYERVAYPTILDSPLDRTGEEIISVAADGDGQAALTWTDYSSGYRPHLYYALVNGFGNIVTLPTIFRTSKVPPPGKPYFTLGYNGYSNTSYSTDVAAGADSAVWPADTDAFTSPGGHAKVLLHYVGKGQTPVTGVTLTATLEAGLTYEGDTSGIVPDEAGNVVTWDLPDLDFLDGGSFVLYVGVPGGATIGSQYGLTLEISQNEADANGLDNLAEVQITAAEELHLPLINR